MKNVFVLVFSALFFISSSITSFGCMVGGALATTFAEKIIGDVAGAAIVGSIDGAIGALTNIKIKMSDSTSIEAIPMPAQDTIRLAQQSAWMPPGYYESSLNQQYVKISGDFTIIPKKVGSTDEFLDFRRVAFIFELLNKKGKQIALFTSVYGGGFVITDGAIESLETNKKYHFSITSSIPKNKWAAVAAHKYMKAHFIR